MGLTLGPSGLIWYPPIGAPNPLRLVPMVAPTGWKVLAGMSLCAAFEPVAIAMCATAVTDGVTVMF